MSSILYRSAEIYQPQRPRWKVQEQVSSGLGRTKLIPIIATFRVARILRKMRENVSSERWLFLWWKWKWEQLVFYWRFIFFVNSITVSMIEGYVISLAYKFCAWYLFHKSCKAVDSFNASRICFVSCKMGKDSLFLAVARTACFRRFQSAFFRYKR